VVDLPESLSFQNARELFTGREARFNNRQLSIAEALSILPFAALTNC